MDERADRTRKTYDAVAQRFVENTRDRSMILPWLGRFAENLAAGARVLDLGGGPGFDAAELRHRGMRAVCLDLSLGMLLAGRAEFPAPRIRTDARSLPLRNASMAGVWANASLLHLTADDAAVAVREVRRVLAGSGLFHLSVKAGYGGEWETQRYGEPRWFQYWEPASLDALLATAGFEVVGAWSNSTSQADWLVRHAVPVCQV